jgi:hypothetical protein
MNFISRRVKVRELELLGLNTSEQFEKGTVRVAILNELLPRDLKEKPPSIQLGNQRSNQNSRMHKADYAVIAINGNTLSNRHAANADQSCISHASMLHLSRKYFPEASRDEKQRRLQTVPNTDAETAVLPAGASSMPFILVFFADDASLREIACATAEMEMYRKHHAFWESNDNKFELLKDQAIRKSRTSLGKSKEKLDCVGSLDDAQMAAFYQMHLNGNYQNFLDYLFFWYRSCIKLILLQIKALVFK